MKTAAVAIGIGIFLVLVYMADRLLKSLDMEIANEAETTNPRQLRKIRGVLSSRIQLAEAEQSGLESLKDDVLKSSAASAFKLSRHIVTLRRQALEFRKYFHAQKRKGSIRIRKSFPIQDGIKTMPVRTTERQQEAGDFGLKPSLPYLFHGKQGPSPLRLEVLRQRQDDWYNSVLEALALEETEKEHHYYHVKPEKVNLRTKLKILVGFLQVVMAMESGINMLWPEKWRSGIDPIRWISLNWYSVDFVSCILNTTYFERYVIQMIVPLVVVLLFQLLRIYAQKSDEDARRFDVETTLKRPKGQSFWSGASSAQQTQSPEVTAGRAATSMPRQQIKIGEIKKDALFTAADTWRWTFILLFLVYPQCTEMVFSLFRCEKLSDGNEYLSADYETQCWTGTHKHFVVPGIFALLIYPLGIPLFIFLALWRQHRKGVLFDEV